METNNYLTVTQVEKEGVVTKSWEKSSAIMRATLRMTPVDLKNEALNMFEKINTSSMAYRIFQDIFEIEELDFFGREYFLILALNRNNKVVCYSIVSMGGMTGTVADGKIIFRTALLSGAAAIILCHNHPSGNLAPSTSDIQLTNRLKQFGTMIDMPILDHIIFTPTSYYSFADEGKM